MDCRAVQDQLLGHDSPGRGPLPAGELADHVDRCENCRRFATELAQLEDAWRAIPLPPNAVLGLDRFLETLPSPIAARRSRSLRRIPTSWVAAASILITLGVIGGLVVRTPRAAASSDVVERLVDWNLILADSTSFVERGQIYAGKAAGFAEELERATVPSLDQALVRSLLEKAPDLVREPDPLVEANRFNDLADRLLERMNEAARRGDARRVDQSAALYRRVAELGIEPKLDVLEASDSLDFERQRRLEHLILEDAGRMKDLIKLLEQAPDSSRKRIKQALGLGRRPRKASAPRPMPAGARRNRIREARLPTPLPARAPDSTAPD